MKTEAERRRTANSAIASGQVEGLGISPAARAIADQYIAGAITAAELGAKIRAVWERPAAEDVTN